MLVKRPQAAPGQNNGPIPAHFGTSWYADMTEVKNGEENWGESYKLNKPSVSPRLKRKNTPVYHKTESVNTIIFHVRFFVCFEAKLTGVIPSVQSNITHYRLRW